jgi:NADH:ubiquinone oxidoreductase subunit F (NADH-binding)
MEGEPAAIKDQALLAAAPHLVLDGAAAMASAIGADHVVVAVARDRSAMARAISRAVGERDGDTASFEIATPPGRYVAGEESALAHFLDGGESTPTYRAERPSLLRIERRPALIDNAETLAHVALIDRHGAQWFREVGDPDAPGTALCSVWPGDLPVCLEAPTDATARGLLHSAGLRGPIAGVLVGGYGGTWIGPEALDAPLTPAGLAPFGASRGAGVLFAVPEGACGLAETASIARFMASESAGQCGPCAFGLPAIAEDLDRLARGLDRRALDHLARRTGAVEGRGACRHPDGVVRMVRSALEVFSADAVRHAGGRPCPRERRRGVAPVPDRVAQGWQ